MRLPWPFGRRTSPDGPPSSTPEGGGTGTGALDAATPGVPGDAVAPATGAWAALPPIQRTVGGPPLVAPSAPFLGDVPGHRPLPPIVEPLGHQSSPAAPAGLVVAHPRPVPSLTSHADLAPRPVQRRAAAEPAPVPSAESFTQAFVPEPERAPVRHLASVSPDATVTPPARPLTRAPSTPAPLHAATVSRSTAASHAPATHAAPAAAVPSSGPALGPGAPASGTAGAARTPGLVKTISRWAEGTATGTRAGLGAPLSPAAAGSASSSPSRGAPGSVPPPGDAAPAATRRAGLGAPIPTPPASAVAQRLPMRPPSAPAFRPVPGQPMGPEGTGPAGSPGTATPSPAMDTTSSPGPVPAVRSLPVLPVSRRHRDHAADPVASGTTSSAVGTAPVPAATPAPAGHASPAILPLLGARPIRTGVTAQRQPADAGPAAAVPAHGGERSSTVPVPVAARWAPGDDLPGTVTALPGTHETASSPVQLSPFPGAPGTPAPDATPSGPREITFPPRDGLAMTGTATTAPSPASRGTGPSAPAMPGVQRLTPGVATRVPTDGATGRPLALARSVAPAPVAETHAAATASVSPGSNRIVSSLPAPSPAPAVQASRSSPAPAIPVMTGTPVVQRVDGAAPSPEAPAQGHSDTELDELARVLFGRIRTHLRAEVIHEREAKGLTFDAF